LTFQNKVEFQAWPKTSRFFRDIVITEKIDGTNAAVQIIKANNLTHWDHEDGTKSFFDPQPLDVVRLEGEAYVVYAQSRNRLIHIGQDNAGFAGWVQKHAAELVTFLGEGTHFGEWWGSGIQRGYGQSGGKKYFSLFNTHRFQHIGEESDNLVRSVPVFYEGPMDTTAITDALKVLKEHGSMAAPGFMNPEGVCVYHTSSRLVQKVTLDNNDAGKWEHLNLN
jgi:hypothetical protein